MTKFVIDNGKNLIQAYDAAELDALLQAKADSLPVEKKFEQYDETYNFYEESLSLSEFSTGKIIDKNGEEQTGPEYSAMSYTSVSITDTEKGRKIAITGSGWYSIQPFVFVGISGNIIQPDINTGSTPTQYNLEFLPKETGTLYLNRYQTNTVKAALLNIEKIKVDYLPDIPARDVVDYSQVELTIISGKLLNANNGTISDEPTHQNWQITDFTEISSTKILISTCHFWGSGMYAFYDENQNFISGQSAAAGGTVTYLYNSVVSVPANAKYIRIGYLGGVQLPNPSLFDGVTGFYNPTQKWNGKKWAVIGDSLTASYSVTDIHYWELIAALTGISGVNMGVSGSGYARGNDNFMTRVLNVPLDSDVVTIFGSGNDGGAGLDLGTASDTGTTTLGGVINTTIDNLYSVLPVVNLGIVTPTPWVNQMPYNNAFMENYSNLIVEICRRRSIPCLDLFHCSNIDPNNAAVREILYSKDNGGGVHPNELGHKMIAAQFRPFLERLIL